MNLLKRWRWESKMDREMRFHLETAIDEFVAQGMPRAEAELRARREFGAVELAKEECRDQKPLEWVEQVIREVRYAIRSLARSPGFAAIAVITLALGIGANTAVFSIVHGVLLRPLPYPDGDRLVSLLERESDGSVNIPEFEFVREHASSFSGVALQRGGGEHGVVAGDHSESAKTRYISSGFFQTLGVLPIEGREFIAQETRPGSRYAVILTKEFATRLYGGEDPIGRIVQVSGVQAMIAGILPAGFWFLDGADVYLPIRAVGDRRDEGFNYEMVARLKSGVNMRQALAEMEPLNESYRRARPDLAGKGARRLTAVSFREWLAGDTRTKLLMLLGAVGLLLLIACANLGGLLAARLAARQREIAVRRALGSSVGRLLRQFLIENLLIAGAGSTAGVLGAYWILDGFVAMIPFGLPASSPIRLDLPVLGFALALTLAVSVVFSIAPALRSARLDVHESLKSGGRMIGSGGRQTSRGALVAMQVALSAALLIGATLLIQSLYRLHHEKLGFDAQGVMTFWVPPAPERRGKIVALRNFETAVEDRLRRIPGIRAVGAVNVIPLTEQNNYPVQREGHPENSIGGMEIRVVTPGYFEAMQIPILRGRALDARDTATSAPVVLVNQAVASRWWPNGDGVGDRLLYGRFEDKVYGGNDPAREVAGVVANTKSVYLQQEPRPTIYIPLAQASFFEENLAWVVKAETGTRFPPEFAAQVRRAIAEIDSRQRVDRFRTMEEIVAATTVESRFDAWLFGGFAGLALLLTAIGVYGLLSFAVVRRTAEIGTRLALGASRGAVLALVLRQGLVLVTIGLVVGMGANALLTRFLAKLLFGVRPGDPLSFIVVTLLLLAAGALASYLPARRAARMDPMVALRCE
jgi:putative ABC transport system permease protein